MHKPALLFLPLLIALTAGCGDLDDPDPEELDTPLTVVAGEAVIGEVRSGDHYDYYDDFEWDLDLDDLPVGFVYRTLDIWLDHGGHLWVEFDLFVSSHVPEGRYRFDAEYEIWDYGDLFNQQVVFEFDVLVLEPHGGPGVHFLVAREVGASETPDETSAPEEPQPEAVRIVIGR